MRERPSAHTTPALRLALALGCPRGASAAAMEHSPKDDRVAYAAGSVVVVEAFSSSSSPSSAPEEDGASSGEFPPSTREFLIGHAADVGLLRHSPDGELLATAEPRRGGSILVWRREEAFRVPNAPGAGNKPSSAPVKSGGSAPSVLPAARWRRIATLPHRAASVTTLDVSPDGHCVLAGGVDESGRHLIAIWDVADAMARGPAGAAPCVLRHRCDYPVACARFSPFEEDRVFACGGGSVRVYRLKGGRLRGVGVDLDGVDLEPSGAIEEASEEGEGEEDEDEGGEEDARPRGGKKEKTRRRSRSSRGGSTFVTLAFDPGSVAIAGTVEPGASSTSPRPRVLIGTSAGAVVALDHDARVPTAAFRLHDAAIASIRVADGFVATASADGFLRAWAPDFSDFFLEAEHDSPLAACSVSSDGASVFVATRAGGVGSLDARTREYAVRVRGAAAEGGEEESSSVALLGDTTSAAHRTHRSPRVAADPTPGSREFALAALGGTARVLRADTGEVTKEFAAPGERVTSLAWRTAGPPGGSDSPPEGSSPSESGSSSGRWLAVGYASGAVRVFDVDAAALVAERFFFRRERDAFFPVDALAFAADGASLFAAGADASVCVFRCDETLFGDERVVPAKTLALAPARPNARTKYPRASLAASPDGGSRVAVAGPRGDRVLVFDAATLKLAGPTIRVTDGRCTALAFAPDSESLFVASESDSDGGASTTLARYPVKRDDAFSPSDDDSEDPSERQSSVSDALRVAAARREADALLFGARQAVARAVAKVSGRVSALATDPRDRGVLLAARGRAVAAAPVASLLDPSDPFVPGGALGRAAREGFAASERRFVAHSDEVADVAFCADGRRIVTVGAGGDAFAWDVFDDALKGLRREAEAASETTTTPADGDHASAGDRPPSDDDPIAGRRLAREAAAFARRRVTDATPLDPSAGSSFSSAAPPPRGPLAPRNRDPEAAARVPLGSRKGATTPTRPSVAPREPIAPPRARTRADQMPASAGYPPAGAAADGAAALWPDPKKTSDEGVLGFRRAAAPKNSIATIRPSRVLGLCSGADAASEESTERAAAVAAASRCPSAHVLPALGAAAYAAGADVVVERLGGDRRQALLRAHAFPVTALAHHAGARLLASASACADAPGVSAEVRAWRADTGARVAFTPPEQQSGINIRAADGSTVDFLRHERCGGQVVALAFSPDGTKLLSLGADPDGGVVAWDVETGAVVATAALAAPAAAAGWFRDSASFFVAGADGVFRFALADEEEKRRRAREERRRAKREEAGGHDGGDDEASGSDDSEASGSESEEEDSDAAAAEFGCERAAVAFDAEGEAPVCTATATDEAGDLLVADARGRLWRSRVAEAGPGDGGKAEEGGDGDAASPAAEEKPLSFSSLAASPLKLCAAALPDGEACTVLATAPGSRLFVGSSRRARAWRETRGDGWEELGELELDGAATSASAFFELAAAAATPETARTRSNPAGVVCTSAGTAWLVELATGVARALVQAHPLRVTALDLCGGGGYAAGAPSARRRVALATVSEDGSMRVFDAASGAKALEAHADGTYHEGGVEDEHAADTNDAKNNSETLGGARTVSCAPDGTHVVMGCGGGALAVIRVAKGADASLDVDRRSGRVVAAGVELSTSCAPARVVAHPHAESGAIVACAFAPPQVSPPGEARGFPAALASALTPLVSVAEDGSVAVTRTGSRADPTPTTLVVAARFGIETEAASIFGEGVASSEPSGRSGTRGSSKPLFVVQDAAIDRESYPTLVAAATARGVVVHAVDAGEARAELRSVFAPDPRLFEDAEAVEGGDVDATKTTTLGGGGNGEDDASPGLARVAWSGSRTGCLYYASANTRGRVALRDVFANATLRIIDLRFLPLARPGGLRGPVAAVRSLAAVASASGTRSGADLLAVGGDAGVEWVEVPAAVVNGFERAARKADAGGKTRRGGGDASELRRGATRLAGGASAVAFADGGDEAWVASGACAYVVRGIAEGLR